VLSETVLEREREREVESSKLRRKLAVQTWYAAAELPSLRENTD